MAFSLDEDDTELGGYERRAPRRRESDQFTMLAIAVLSVVGAFSLIGFVAIVHWAFR